MAISSVGMLWVILRRSGARKQHHARIHLLLASAWLIVAIAWFVPSESGSALMAVAGTLLATAGVIWLMISTWRQATIRE